MEQTKTEKQVKASFIVKVILLVLFGAGVVCTFIFNESLFGESSIFNKSVSSNSVVNTLFWCIPKLIRSVQIIVIAMLLSIAVRFLMKKLFARSNKAITIVKLLSSFIKYLIAIIALLMVLGAWGVDTATLLASVGILSLIIGLGAQSLVEDIIAGIFIVFEGTYQVGDIIVIDDWRGTVEEIGIRTTKIVSGGGDILIVNNSQISSVVNKTQELSVASVSVGIEYGESLERVETIIDKNLDNIKANIPAIVQGPFYKGVKELADSSVNLQFVAKCKEGDIYQVQRDLNRELKLLFDKNKVNIPFPQIVLNQPEEHTTKVSKKISADAQEFVDEQRELSKGIEEKR